MSTRDKMKVFSGATAVLFIITGIVLGVVTYMTYNSDKRILSSREYAICTVSDIVKEDGKRVVKGNYLAYDESWTVDLVDNRVSRDVVVGDSFKVFFEKGKPENVFSEYLIERTKKMLLILFVIAIGSLLLGIFEMYFLVLRWDVLYPLPKKKVKRVVKRTPPQRNIEYRQVRPMPDYNEDLDLWGDDTVPAYNSNSMNSNRYGQVAHQTQGRGFSYPSYGTPRQGGADFPQSDMYGGENTVHYMTTPNRSDGTYQRRPTNKNKNIG